jgi:DnaK suppressor protein
MGRLASGVVEQRHAELLSNLRQDLDDVEAAMRRLEEGTYGQCEVCAAPLAVEQLQARPADRRCPTCS